MAWKPPPPQAGCARSSTAWPPSTAGPCGRPHRAPIDELVLTVLSQNTNDRNRDVAYERLRDRFESWDAVREAPVEEVVEAIRPGGLAVTKAPRIQEILRAIGDDDLSRLADEPLAQAREELCELPGRGPQDSGLRAAVLLRPPRRAGGHPRAPGGHPARPVPARRARSRRRTTRCCGCRRGSDPYEAHVSLIRHGRRTCHARAPRCDECPLRRMCPYARGELER